MTQTFVQKAASAAGAIAAVSVPVTTEAVVLYRTGSPVSMSLGGGPSSVGWDVDGTGGPDFALTRSTGFYSRAVSRYVPSVTYYGGAGGRLDVVAVRKSERERVTLDSVAGRGGGIIGPIAGDERVQALRSSFQIGATLGAYHWNTVTGFPDRQALFRSTRQYLPFHTIAEPGYTNVSSNFGERDFATADGFARSGENVIGFRFDRGLGTDLNYGWAKVEWDLSNQGSESFTITEWAWETDPGKPIHAVPAPAAAVSGLSLLAMGAAGVRRQRRRANVKAEAA